ncbi:MAG: hypothetical protein ACM3JI_02020 [Anaerolineae bacterium]
MIAAISKKSCQKITAIISFCTNDLRFLKACVESACLFCEQIIVCVSDHFFDGTLEDLACLEWIYQRYPTCTFIEFAYDPNAPYGFPGTVLPEDIPCRYHWHDASRLVALYFLNKNTEYALFLDVDEIFDPIAFQTWLEGFDYKNYAALRFASYWYFRKSSYQAMSWPDSALLIKRSFLNPDLFLDPDERMGVFFKIKGKKMREVLGLDGLPMVHHYSWVRSKQEMLKKAASWAHHWERNWLGLIEEEFSREFEGEDFVRYYRYKTVEERFDPLKETDLPFSLAPVSYSDHIQNLKTFAHVTRVDSHEIFRRDLKMRFEI